MAKVLVDTKNITRKEWLKKRQMGIGGSDVASLFGLNPYKSLLSLYFEKSGQLEEKEDEENEAMRQGRDFEDYVAKRFEEKTGKKLRKRNAILQHPKYNFLIADVDRLVVGENAGWEGKTSSPFNYDKWTEGKIPFMYQLQCQHYMAVTGMEKWYISCLFFQKEVIHREVKRDEGVIQRIIEEGEHFWENHVKAGVMPDPDGSEDSNEMLVASYPSAEDKKEIILFEEEFSEMLPRYKMLKEREDEIKTEIEQIKQFFKKHMEDAEVATVNGIDNAQIRWSNVNSSMFDAKKFKKEQPELYNKYVKTRQSRRFEIKITE